MISINKQSIMMIKVSGTLSGDNITELASDLNRFSYNEAYNTVILDLSLLTYIDFKGISIISEFKKQFINNKKSLHIVEPKESFKKMIENISFIT